MNTPIVNRRTRARTGFVRPGLRLPRHRATTAHLAALYPFHADAGLGPRGIYVGEDVSAGGAAWCYDPFQLYTDGVLTSPNILVLGVVGSGKSSAVKTLLYRSIGLLGSPDGKPRWCAILDPKGEYGPLADALGRQRLRLYPGGPTRLNPLDAGLQRASADELRTRRTHQHQAAFGVAAGVGPRPGLLDNSAYTESRRIVEKGTGRYGAGPAAPSAQDRTAGSLALTTRSPPTPSPNPYAGNMTGRFGVAARG